MATDSLGWLDALEGLPEQLAAAHEAANTIAQSDLPSFDGVRTVVVAGMGGSAIAGDVLDAVASGALPVPVQVLRRYRLPAFVDEDTLFFAMSYSGGTEETVAMTEAAFAAGARVVAVTRGGELGELVDRHGALRITPPEVPLPRAALGGLVAPLFALTARGGLLAEGHGLLVQAQAQLAARREKCKPSVEGTANPARELARRIGRTIPIFYGGGALGAVAAYRWKCDVNENTKAPAFWHAHPELDHNEICGWGLHGDVTRQVFTLVELRHGYEHERLSARFPAVREIIEETLVDVLEVTAEGDGRLAQLLDLMYLGDWTSSYLAFDQDVDPGPIDAISQLKARLADIPR